MASHGDFADFCCELLCNLGPLRKRRMFGGWGLSLDGLTMAIVVDLGGGEKLWLKADAESARDFEAAHCARFTYSVRKGDATVQRGINYFSPPDEAMDSAHAMAPWARMAMESALKAHAAAAVKTRRTPARAVRATRQRP